MGTQKEYPKHPEINLQSLTLYSIIKDAAKNALFQKKMSLYDNLLKNAKSEMKKFLIKEIVSMIQE